jgi:hypothetical protein
MCMPNYKKWCSAMFLFIFLVKASDFVPILSQQYLQQALNDVALATQLILWRDACPTDICQGHAVQHTEAKTRLVITCIPICGIFCNQESRDTATTSGTIIAEICIVPCTTTYLLQEILQGDE